jgi:translation initiation factor 4A
MDSTTNKDEGVQALALEQLDPNQVYETFDAMNLKSELLRGIFNYGFEEPSLIQRRGIIPIVCGRDVLGQAQSGTGKTGTFVIGVLQRIDSAVKGLQAILLSPTHEIARQTYNVVAGLSSKMELKTHLCIGGGLVRDDITALKGGAQLIVGTPGRILDLMERKAINTNHMRTIVVDEADQMLENNFQVQIFQLLQYGFPEEAQIALFSATLPENVVELADKMLRNPIRILRQADQVTLEGIKQYMVVLDKEEHKFEALCDIYRHFTIGSAIIYTNQRKKVEWLAAKMKEAGFALECIHGEMDTNERRKKMADFAGGHARVLISTDLLSRGIDVQQLGVVINYDLPVQKENYIHRIGRSGRYGKKGVAINLLTGNDIRYMKDIEKFYSTVVVDLPSDFGNIM